MTEYGPQPSWSELSPELWTRRNTVLDNIQVGSTALVKSPTGFGSKLEGRRVEVTAVHSNDDGIPNGIVRVHPVDWKQGENPWGTDIGAVQLDLESIKNPAN